eukprot:TRINITY_DN14303_c0_g4_i6.p2 TRINITY_DN14303_c0_g4~~TRINITY_DN14303_c0_g4_i6.p2  ORF type:complete len:177 (+),score=39.06 TRINITY_DN14303_c0_g4_i6:1020-1550(+)
MEDHETIIISGAEQFSEYSGYGGAFRWVGDHLDKTPFNETMNCLDNHIVAIDAIMYPQHQYLEGFVLRDINKFFVGLQSLPVHQNKMFVTGHWGCGAFRGDKQLKAVQQIIGASEAGYQLVYSTFKDKAFLHSFSLFVKELSWTNITVKELYKHLISFNNSRTQSVFEYIISKIKA